MSDSTVDALRDMAERLRIHSIESTTKAGSGHPTSCASMAEIMATLFFDVMRYHVHDPRSLDNDRFVLSKGHAAPILYAAWAEAGLFPQEDLLRLREMDCDLEGHPTPRLDFVDVATGSLGQGLSAGCGMAYERKLIGKSDARIYVLLGDGESAEGSVWEAMSFASFYKLDNLCGIIDVNRLGQSDPTMFQHDMDIYQRRCAAFGWNSLVVDGHDIPALQEAFAQAASTTGKPTMILAKTLKGKGIPGIEDQDGWHGKSLDDKTDDALAAIRSRMTGANGLAPKAPTTSSEPLPSKEIVLPAPEYKQGDKVATRAAYGTALHKLGAADDRVVALDADVKNSSYSGKFRGDGVAPERFVECYIAEQNLVGAAVGMGRLGRVPFASTFACFLSRAYDQIRMGAISLSNVTYVGSHAGISIGADGPSQMALEDLAMFRAIPHCVVFYPTDAVACEKAVELAANYPRNCFIRTSRPGTVVRYANDEKFEIGKAKVLRSSDDDKVTVVGAAVTIDEAMKAADRLAEEGINLRVVDPFTIKPLDRDTLLDAARATGGKVLTVEDHYPEGGIGEAVAATLADEPGVVVHRLAVDDVPRSGEPEELLSRFGIDADAIVAAVRKLLA